MPNQPPLVKDSKPQVKTRKSDILGRKKVLAGEQNYSSVFSKCFCFRLFLERRVGLQREHVSFEIRGKQFAKRKLPHMIHLTGSV